MKVTKVSPAKFETMVKAYGKGCTFVKLPSTVEGYAYGALLMASCAYVPWPDNLTDDEMTLYIEKYGTPPDIFTPNYDEKVAIRNVIRGEKNNGLRIIPKDGPSEGNPTEVT